MLASGSLQHGLVAGARVGRRDGRDLVSCPAQRHYDLDVEAFVGQESHTAIDIMPLRDFRT